MLCCPRVSCVWRICWNLRELDIPFLLRAAPLLHVDAAAVEVAGPDGTRPSEYVYRVNPLPASMLDVLSDYGNLDARAEVEYARHMLSVRNLF